MSIVVLCHPGHSRILFPYTEQPFPSPAGSSPPHPPTHPPTSHTDSLLPPPSAHTPELLSHRGAAPRSPPHPITSARAHRPTPAPTGRTSPPPHSPAQHQAAGDEETDEHHRDVEKRRVLVKCDEKHGGHRAGRQTAQLEPSSAEPHRPPHHTPPANCCAGRMRKNRAHARQQSEAVALSLALCPEGTPRCRDTARRAGPRRHGNGVRREEGKSRGCTARAFALSLSFSLPAGLEPPRFP